MKIQPEHYQALVAALKACAPRKRPISHSQRWNWLWRAKFGDLTPSTWLCHTLYQYLNDDHIETALRRASTDIYGE